MKITKQLAADLLWIAEQEDWDTDTKALAKECLTQNPAYFCNLFTIYAQARRAGYVGGNGHVQVAAYCADNQIDNPYEAA